MTGTYLAAAGALVIAGIVTGVFIVVCLGIHREERRSSLTKASDNRIDRGVRRLNGAGSRGYWLRVVSDDDSDDRDSDDRDSHDRGSHDRDSYDRGSYDRGSYDRHSYDDSYDEAA
jgi:hypothetical protein